MMNRLVEGGYITQAVADDVEGHVQEIVEAMHAMLTDTPSLLLQAALVDGVGECRSQNQPGTSSARAVPVRRNAPREALKRFPTAERLPRSTSRG